MIHDSTDKAEQSPGVCLGSYGWQHAHWDGVFYPDDLPEDWQLAYYSNEFSAVLVPRSYWETGTGFDVESWQEDVSDDFRFYIEWPFNHAEGEDASLCLEQCQGLGRLFGGIVVNQDFELITDLPVYYTGYQRGSLLQQVWTAEHHTQSGVAFLKLTGADLRTQRKWLEQFAESTGSLRCILLSDAAIEIDSLRNMKTLIELLGL